MHCASASDFNSPASFSWPGSTVNDGSVDISTDSIGADKSHSTEVTLQVENSVQNIDVSLQTFYLSYMVHTARAFQRALLQRITSYGAVPKVQVVRADPSEKTHCLWADILCQTLESYAHLVQQYSSGQLKKKLEGELKKFDYNEKLEVSLLGHEDVVVREGTDTPGSSRSSMDSSIYNSFENSVNRKPIPWNSEQEKKQFVPESSFGEASTLREKVEAERRNMMKDAETNIEDDLDLVFKFLKTRVGRNWREFLRCLGASEAEIRNLWLVHFNVRGWHDCIYQGLLLWRLREQSEATIDKLLNALDHITVMRIDIKDELEKYWNDLKYTEHITQSQPDPPPRKLPNGATIDALMGRRKQDTLKEKEKMLALLEGTRILKQQKRKAKKDFFSTIGSDSSAFSRVDKDEFGIQSKSPQRHNGNNNVERTIKSDTWPRQGPITDWGTVDNYLTSTQETLDEMDKFDRPENGSDHRLNARESQPCLFERKKTYNSTTDCPSHVWESNHRVPIVAKILNERRKYQPTHSGAVRGNGELVEVTPYTDSVKLSSKSSGFYESNGTPTDATNSPPNSVFTPQSDDGYFTFPTTTPNTAETSENINRLPVIEHDDETASYYTASGSTKSSTSPNSLTRLGHDKIDAPQLSESSTSWNTTLEDMHWEDFQNMSLREFQLNRGVLGSSKTPSSTNNESVASRSEPAYTDSTPNGDVFEWQNFDNSTPTYYTPKGIRHFTPIKPSSSAESSCKFGVIDEEPSDYVTANNCPDLEDDLTAVTYFPTEMEPIFDFPIASSSPMGHSTNTHNTPEPFRLETYPEPHLASRKSGNSREKPSEKQRDRKKQKDKPNFDKIDDMEPIDDYQDTDGVDVDKPRRKRYTKRSPSKKLPNRKGKLPNRSNLFWRTGKEIVIDHDPADKPAYTPVGSNAVPKNKLLANNREKQPNSSANSTPETNRCIMCPLPTFRKSHVKPTEFKDYRPPPSPWELRTNDNSEEEIGNILSDDKNTKADNKTRRTPSVAESANSEEVQQFMKTFPRFHRSSKGSSTHHLDDERGHSPWELRNDENISLSSAAHLVARSGSVKNGSITPSFGESVFESPWITRNDLEAQKDRLRENAEMLIDDLRMRGLADIKSDKMDQDACFLMVIGETVRHLLEENNQDTKNIYALKHVDDNTCEVNLHKKDKNSKPGKVIPRRKPSSDEELNANIKHTLYGNYTLNFQLKKNKKPRRKQPSSAKRDPKLKYLNPVRPRTYSRDSPP
ncbi:uncharacterized protein LOC100370565 [Saccoglossus kowalevskii]|uniref:Uncharacterized protein LOC100370565 n=1 Tax=Saccoglossus kowalevskii TaxID=10224 RepID=A0ABM0GTX5_SACKO|nr:PREDICTED: uncharacterized protein LOC100370565 [Saccoglossus kowalevskii]